MSEALTIDFQGETLTLDISGAVYLPQAQALIVADLHFGRALRGARHGGALLPVYELAETLSRLEAVIHRTAPAQVICLGDSFDFEGAELTLPAEAEQRLLTLQAGRQWVWLTGNHDPAPLSLPGTHRAEMMLGALTLRHIALVETQTGEISAHFHPKVSLGGRRRPCFVMGNGRLILPAFGAFTGGMDITRPPLCSLIPKGMAFALGRNRLYRVPI